MGFDGFSIEDKDGTHKNYPGITSIFKEVADALRSKKDVNEVFDDNGQQKCGIKFSGPQSSLNNIKNKFSNPTDQDSTIYGVTQYKSLSESSDISNLFRDLPSSYDFANIIIDGSKITNMDYTFYNSPTAIDNVEFLNVPKASMNYTFADCVGNIKNLEGFIPQATSVIGMFQNFNGNSAHWVETTIQFNSSINNISDIFNEFKGLNLNINLNLMKIKNAQNAFENSYINGLTIGDIDTDLDLDNCSRMFKDSRGIKSLKAKNLNISDASYMFSNSDTNIEALSISNVTNAASMFESLATDYSIGIYNSCPWIPYGNIDISKAKNTSRMFVNFNSYHLNHNPLYLNFCSVEDASYMFYNYKNYYGPNIHISETSKIKNIDEMFGSLQNDAYNYFIFKNNISETETEANIFDRIDILNFSEAKNARGTFNRFRFYNNTDIILTNAKNIKRCFDNAYFSNYTYYQGHYTGSQPQWTPTFNIYFSNDIDANYAFSYARLHNNVSLIFSGIKSAVSMFENATEVNGLSIDTSNIKYCQRMFANTDYNQEINIMGAINTDNMLFNDFNFKAPIIYNNDYLYLKAVCGTYINTEGLNLIAEKYCQDSTDRFSFTHYYGFNQNLNIKDNIKFFNMSYCDRFGGSITFNDPNSISNIQFTNCDHFSGSVVIPKHCSLDSWQSDTRKGIFYNCKNMHANQITIESDYLRELRDIEHQRTGGELWHQHCYYYTYLETYSIVPMLFGEFFSNHLYKYSASTYSSSLLDDLDYRLYLLPDCVNRLKNIYVNNLVLVGENVVDYGIPELRVGNLTIKTNVLNCKKAYLYNKDSEFTYRETPIFHHDSLESICYTFSENSYKPFSGYNPQVAYCLTIEANKLEYSSDFTKNSDRIGWLHNLTLKINDGIVDNFIDIVPPQSIYLEGNCNWQAFFNRPSEMTDTDRYFDFSIVNSPTYTSSTIIPNLRLVKAINVDDISGIMSSKSKIFDDYTLTIENVNNIKSIFSGSRVRFNSASFKNIVNADNCFYRAIVNSYVDYSNTMYFENIKSANSCFENAYLSIDNIYFNNIQNLKNAFLNADFRGVANMYVNNSKLDTTTFSLLKPANTTIIDNPIFDGDSVNGAFNLSEMSNFTIKNVNFYDKKYANSTFVNLNFNNYKVFVEDSTLNNIIDASSMFENSCYLNEPLLFENIEIATKMFKSTSGFNLQEGSVLNTSKIVQADEMFYGAGINFEQIPSFDFNNVVHANSIFRSCENFNQPISFSSIKYTQNAFENCENFNSPITVPEETIIENASSMFRNCKLFNSPIGFKIANADYMFSGCESFNRFVNLDGTINGNNMFNGCSNFNQSVTLDGQTLTDYNSMFVGVSFDGKTIKANYLNDYSQQPFVGCNFNSCKIQINNSPYLLSFGGMVNDSKIYIDNTQASGHHYSGTQITINNNTNIYVTSIPQDSLKYQTTYSFYSLGGHGTATFNNSLEVKNVYADPQIDIIVEGNVGKVSGISLGGDQDLTLSEGITDVSYLLKDSPSFNKSITIPSSVVNASHLINNCQNFDSPVVIPGSVKDTSYMFVNCSKFNQDIVIPEGVENISYMFDSCSNFNPPNSIVIPNSVTSYEGLINNCVNFQGSFELKNTEMSLAPIIRGTWYNGSGILTTLKNADCNNEFHDLYGFNQPVTMTETVENAQRLFYNCYSYNLKTTIGTGVKDASRMFECCYNFDSPVIIPEGVENISYMFRNCGSFNQEITIPTSVVNYEGVFENSVFNAPIHCDNKDLLKGIIRYSYYNASGINEELQIPNDGSVTSTGRWYENLYGFNQDIEIPAGIYIDDGILANCYNFNANITVHESLSSFNTPQNLFSLYRGQGINVLTMNNFDFIVEYGIFNNLCPINTLIFDPNKNTSGPCAITSLIKPYDEYYVNNIVIGNNVTNVEYLINCNSESTWNGSITLGNSVKNLTNMITHAKNFNQSIVFPNSLADGGVWDNMLAYCSNWDSTVTWANGDLVDITNAVRGTKYSGPLNTTLPSRESLNFYFADYYGLNQEVIIPEETKYIVGIFKNCYNFNQNVIIPDGVLEITNGYGYNSMFANCWNFNSNVVIGNGVSSASYLFNNLQNFDANVTFGSGLRDLSYMFNNCQKFNQPITVTSEAGWIPNSMLSNCQNFNSQIRIKGLPSGSECQTGDIENVPKILYHCNNFNQSIKYIDGTDLGTNELMSLVHYSGYNGTGLGIPEGIVNAQNWFKDLYRFNQDIIIPDSMVSSDSDFNWNTTDMLHNCFSWNANIFYNNRTPVDFELGFYKTTGYNGSLFAKGWGTITIDGKEFINMTDDYENSDSLDKFYGFNQPVYFNNSPVRLPYNFASELVIDCGPIGEYSSCSYNSLSGGWESPHNSIYIKDRWGGSYWTECYHNPEKNLPLVKIIDCNSDKGQHSFNFTGITTERLVLENSYVSNLNINVLNPVTLQVKDYDGSFSGVGVFAPSFNQQITLSSEKFIDNVPCLFLQKSEFNSPIVYSDGTKPEGNVLKTLVANSCYNQPRFNEALDLTLPDYSSQLEEGNYDYHYQNLYGFNQPVVIPNKTDTFATINMCNTFSNCQNFNQPVVIPDKIYNMYGCFTNCSNFNQDITIFANTTCEETYLESCFENASAKSITILPVGNHTVGDNSYIPLYRMNNAFTNCNCPDIYYCPQKSYYGDDSCIATAFNGGYNGNLHLPKDYPYKEELVRKFFSINNAFEFTANILYDWDIGLPERCINLDSVDYDMLSSSYYSS